MNILPRFIWQKLNPDINISSGRGICAICEKTLNEICKLPGDKKYYCRTHAKEKLFQAQLKPKLRKKHKVELPSKIKTYIEPNKKIHNHTIKKAITEEQEFRGLCDNCNIKIGGLDVYLCKYCGKHFCSKHRVPENHSCDYTGKKATLRKEGLISYK